MPLHVGPRARPSIRLPTSNANLSVCRSIQRPHPSIRLSSSLIVRPPTNCSSTLPPLAQLPTIHRSICSSDPLSFRQSIHQMSTCLFQPISCRAHILPFVLSVHPFFRPLTYPTYVCPPNIRSPACHTAPIRLLDALLLLSHPMPTSSSIHQGL